MWVGAEAGCLVPVNLAVRSPKEQQKQGATPESEGGAYPGSVSLSPAVALAVR